MGSDLRTWKTKRYVKGVRAKNAGISLTKPEIELIDQECRFVAEKTGKTFTRTALVRYCLEEYFGEEWQGSLRAALHQAAEAVGQEKPRKRNAGKVPSASTTENTGSETSAEVTENPVSSAPEAVSSEVI